ncbi:MAG: GTP-binding protein [Candidatus Heimdallarchaeota archaeon]
MPEDKSLTTSLITLGHIDHGKSTTMGRFLFEIGVVDKRTMDRLEAESQELKRASWKWAYVLDSTEEERQGGITSDIAFQPFDLEDKSFMLIDAPGHRDYVKNAIQGAVLADACMVLVSVVPNDLRSGFKSGSGSDPGGQAREHCILGSVLGINQVIFLINKMDMVDYSEKAYNEAVTTIKSLLSEIQSPWVKKIFAESFIPISGLNGENLIKKSEKLSWWKGPTLKEALISFNPAIINSDNKRFLTHDSFEMPGIGTVLYGRMISGVLKPEEKIKVLPSTFETEVKEVYDVNSEIIPSLRNGKYGIISLRSIEKENILPGTVLVGLNDNINPPSNIDLKVLILSNTARPLIPGTNVIIHVGLSHSSAQIEEILSIDSSKKKRVKGKKILMAFPGELANIRVKPDMPIIVDRYQRQPILGRVILRKEGSTIAVGICTNYFS